MKTLPLQFYRRPATVVAQELLGRILLHREPSGELVSGRIVETEAYDETDPAAHCYRGITPRNRPMFGPGGRVYVYRSYGIHWCLNVTCGPDAYGAAVLLRALEPLEGIATMRRRRSVHRDRDLARGPGRLTQAMGVDHTYNEHDLRSAPLWIATPKNYKPPFFVATPRIGIRLATDWPWRFLVTPCSWVSGKKVSCPTTSNHRDE